MSNTGEGVGEQEIYSALILNDYEGKHYAQWVKEMKKTIETRMGRIFKYRGDLVICCGAGKSVTKNAGKALCIVNLFDARPMVQQDEMAACIGWHPKLGAHLLRDWRWFSRDFEFRHYYVSGPYQGIFKIKIPYNVKILNTQP